nr:hypothetical protein [Niabella aurantiaca]
MGTSKRSAKIRGKYHPQIYADDMQAAIRGKYHPQIYADDMQAAINGYSEKISENQREILPADLRR